MDAACDGGGAAGRADGGPGAARPRAGHAVLALWTRPVRGGGMVAQQRLRLVAGRGVEGDHAFGGPRHVTIVFEDDWKAALADLGRPVDPSARRANVLVSGGGGPALLGRTVRLGEAQVEILGIVDPCGVMDRAAPGLRAALQPDGRAGVWGRVATSGAVTTGQWLRDDR